MLLDVTWTITAIAVCTEVTGDFKADRSRLYAQNALKKSTGYISTPCSVLPFTQVDALEIRLFDESGELKAIRANIGQDFIWRYINDDGVSDDCTYDETQYLDAAKNDSTDYVSIGGGHYEMPDAGYERVLIRHYGEYNADGMFELKDFRLKKLMRKGE